MRLPCHVIRFITNLAHQNRTVMIDVLSPKKVGREIDTTVKTVVNSIFWTSDISSSPYFIGLFKYILSLFRITKDIFLKTKYDIINIQYIQPSYYFVLDRFKRNSNCILVTPWGSDIYRRHKWSQWFIERIFSASNYICINDNRFGRDITRFYSIPKSKMVKLDIGSETIDYILEKKTYIDKKKSRDALGLKGDYFITCGYNGRREQNHLYIVDAVAKARKDLPSELVLLFPFTYLADPEYTLEVEQALAKYNLKARFFKSYLSLEELYYLRQATDMFIHVQTTDANSLSVHEYLLLDKTVINGSWLRYEELERDGLPYYIADTLESLPQSIKTAVMNKDSIVTDQAKNYVSSYGWKTWIKLWDNFFTTCI